MTFYFDRCEKPDTDDITDKIDNKPDPDNDKIPVGPDPDGDRPVSGNNHNLFIPINTYKVFIDIFYCQSRLEI